MKIFQYVLFFTVFLSIYGFTNFYIYLRGSQALAGLPVIKRFYPIIFLLLCLAFFIGRIMEKMTVCLASDLFVWIGSLWFAYMLYLFLAVVFFDIIRLINWLTDFYPAWIKTHYVQVRMFIALGVIITTTIIAGIGFINAKTPVIKKINLSIPKKAGTLTSLKIALATDIHLGTIISNSRLEKLIKTINNLKPDIVLLGGDIVDEDLKPVIENNLGAQLKSITSPYGTYAITGNHEYIGGAEKACAYLEQHNIHVLRDSYKLIADSFYIIGREDRSMVRFTGEARKPLSSIVNTVNKTLPLILLDHQPFGLDEAMKSGIDMQLSGHTHAGQLWPVSYIVKAIYTLSYGYKKIKNTHFYVSSGFGTWGPPVRTGNTPEVVYITLYFK